MKKNNAIEFLKEYYSEDIIARLVLVMNYIQTNMMREILFIVI